MMNFHRQLNRLGGLIDSGAGIPAKYFRDPESVTLTVSAAAVTSEDLGSALPIGIELFDFWMECESLGDLFPPKLHDRIETGKGIFKVIGRGGNSSAFEFVTSDEKRLVLSAVREKKG